MIAQSLIDRVRSPSAAYNFKHNSSISIPEYITYLLHSMLCGGRGACNMQAMHCVVYNLVDMKSLFHLTLTLPRIA